MTSGRVLLDHTYSSLVLAKEIDNISYNLVNSPYLGYQRGDCQGCYQQDSTRAAAEADADQEKG